MIFERSIIWPLIAASYAVLGGALFHAVFGGWSGIVTLGLLFAIPIGVPSLVGYAAYLWRKNLLIGFARWEALICVLYPIVLLAFGAGIILTAKW
jgi:hypothetical protein